MGIPELFLIVCGLPYNCDWHGILRMPSQPQDHSIFTINICSPRNHRPIKRSVSIQAKQAIHSNKYQKQKKNRRRRRKKAHHTQIFSFIILICGLDCVVDNALPAHQTFTFIRAIFGPHPHVHMNAVSRMPFSVSFEQTN